MTIAVMSFLAYVVTDCETVKKRCRNRKQTNDLLPVPILFKRERRNDEYEKRKNSDGFPL